MNNKTIILAVIIAAALISLGAFTPGNFGATLVTGSSYFGATNASSSVPASATTTNPILSLDATRTNATICNISATSTVFLHQLSQSTTTGVTIDTGIALRASSTAGNCVGFPGFKGYLFGVCPAAGSCKVTTSAWK